MAPPLTPPLPPKIYKYICICPQLARLKKIEAPVDKKGRFLPDAPLEKVDLYIDWYYRPEDIPGLGRRVFHGRREVLTSDHADKASAASVEGRVTVHTLDAYRSLPAIGPSDYFWRFKFLAGSRKFVPERVPVYCTCGIPYSPDLLLIQCGGGCEEWFHPGCVGLSEAEARKYEAAAARGAPVGEAPTFVCPTCGKGGDGGGGGGRGGPRRVAPADSLASSGGSAGGRE